MMNETQRTLAFVGVAIVSLLAAVFVSPSTSDPLADVQLGTEFYPDFKDPTAAASLSVIVYNDDTATIGRFSVENDNGVWKIPSHNNYHADGAERLAKTAASLVGVKRDAFQSRLASSHEALGVIAPDDEDTSRLKGRGDRLTLKDKDGNTLVDFIIGKQVEDRDGYYYVRKVDNNATYIAKLDVDLSTKFSDWVETDLLKLNRDDLNGIVINKYSIEERARSIAIVDKEENILSREKSSDPWNLNGLNPETEELDTAKINEMISSLDDLKLIGVRPKPAGLSETLKVDQSDMPKTENAFRDLLSKGFFPMQEGLLSNEGEVIASTNKGVAYVLRFGEIFSGSGLAIEAGVEADKKDTQKADGEKKEENDGDSTEGDKEEDKDGDATQGRYLFAFAQFDEAALGPKPTEPQKPAPAEEAPPAEDAKDEAEAVKKDEETAEKADKKEGEAEGDKKETAEETKPEEKQDKPDPQKEYETALAKYKTDLAAYEKKVADGKKEVAELNRRFADWYYVISQESFQKLRLSRDELVKAKEKEPEESKTPESIPKLEDGN